MLNPAITLGADDNLLSLGLHYDDFSGTDAGNMALSSQWQNEGKELGISLVDHIDGRDALRVGGSYFLQEKRLDLQASLEQFPLAVASVFLPDIITDLSGAYMNHVTVLDDSGGSKTVPAASELENWRSDYAEMQRHFIFGKALPFDDLLKRMEELRERFRAIGHSE